MTTATAIASRTSNTTSTTSNIKGTMNNPNYIKGPDGLINGNPVSPAVATALKQIRLIRKFPGTQSAKAEQVVLGRLKMDDYLRATNALEEVSQGTRQL